MDVTGDPVALIYNKPGDEGSAYTLRLPSGKEVVIGDAEDDYLRASHPNIVPAVREYIERGGDY